MNTLADLCGLKVAAQKGTVQADDATAQSKKCTADGKKAVDVQIFPDQNGVNLALKSGRVQVAMADSPVAAYAVKQSNGAFKLVGESYDNAPYGIAVPKDSGLAQPMVDAIKALIVLAEELRSGGGCGRYSLRHVVRSGLQGHSAGGHGGSGAGAPRP